MRKIAVATLGVFGYGLVIAQDPSTACLAELRADSRIQAIEQKVPFDVSKGQPLEVLASKAKPNNEEKAALSFLASEGERCFDLGSEWRQKNYPPEVNALMTTYRVEMVSALADLYAGNITYGELAKFRAKQVADLKNNVDAIAAKAEAKRVAKAQHQQELAAQQQQEQQQAQAQREANIRQEEEARRQAALQLLLNRQPYQPYVQQPYLVPVPQTTNCTAFGNQLRCTTR